MMLAWRLARRDLRGGWSGLGLLFLCLALSLAGVSAVTSLAAAVDRSIAANGRELLGGDLALSIAGRAATPEEAMAIGALGRPAQATMVRAMLVVPGGDSALAELSGVGDNWPAAGHIDLAPGGTRPHGAEVAIDARLAARLSVARGGEVAIGGKPFRISAIIEHIPGGGFALAPPALLDEAGLRRSALIQPGSLTTTSYRLRLRDGADPAAAAKAFAKRFAAGGWRVTTRAEAASGTRRLVDSLGALLSLLALTALAIGGIGINSAAAAFAAAREPRVAMLKLVGARRRTLLAMLGLEVGAVALAAMTVGLLVGAATPAVVGHFTAGLLPVAPDPRPQWTALALSAAFGTVAVAASSWGPLANAIATRPASLLRGALDTGGGARAPAWLFAALGVALAIGSSNRPTTIAVAVAVLGALALLFAGAGWAIRRAARALRHRGGAIFRLGLAGLDRPGAATVRLAVSLGLGMSLLVALAGGASSLLNTVRGQTEARAPALFLLDVPKDRAGDLQRLAAQRLPGGEVRMLPSLRGPVVAVNGVPVGEMRDLPEGAWVLRGDRGLTFMADPPPGNRIVAGQWWPRDYAGPPLISLDADAAAALKLKVGDRLTVAVLGRPIEARIASLRQIDWRSLGFNFAIIFDPHSLGAAPFTWMASVAPARGAPTDQFERAVGVNLPMVSQIRVAEIVAEVERLLAALAGAIKLGAGFALLVGVVVLAGSVVATRATRAREIVLLRLVGATRRQTTLAQGVEYAVIAGSAGAVALVAGLAIAWAVCRFLFDIPFVPDWAAVTGIPLAGAITASLAALAAAQGALRVRPAVGLRNHSR